ncbi:hypothetical protein [Glycomyces tenuis]|uniref:hypothetical protein n=1 Tax=Glycomyces tenuis TaxID=58116 RepID=UPI00041F49C9|nr:hypothetical protein [Glycomyces tenuis]
MTGPMFVAALALAAVLAVGVCVLVTEVAARRPVGRHRAGRVIEGELVDESTLPIPVGRWR